MSSIADRLREERERLAMNQTAFGAVGGVLKGAQLNYEAGKRIPDAEYLGALAKIGVDVAYVVTGQRGPVQSQGVQLQDGEAMLLEGYRALDARGRAGVMALIAGLTPASKPKAKKVDVVQHAHGDGTTQIGKVRGGLTIGKK